MLKRVVLSGLVIALCACFALAGCGSKSSSAKASGESASAQAAPASSAPASKYAVSIDDAAIGADYKGQPTIVVTYTWQNNSDETRSYASSLHAKCFQDGVQLETAIMSEGINSDGFMADVRPGHGTTFQIAYELKSQSDVEVEVSEMISFSDSILAERTFSVK